MQGQDVSKEQSLPQKPDGCSREQTCQTEPRTRKGRVVRSAASVGKRILLSVPSSPCESEIPFGPYLQGAFVNAYASLMRGFFVPDSWPNGMAVGFPLKSELPLFG
jgi:hypothetical protein